VPQIRPHPIGEGDGDGDRVFYKQYGHNGRKVSNAIMPEDPTTQPEPEREKRSLDQPKRALKRPKIKIPKKPTSLVNRATVQVSGRAAAAHTLKGRLDSSRLKAETLASLDVLWEAVDDGSITVDDLHDAEADIEVLIEKFRHGPNRYIARKSL